ncbi:MAG TPA: VWA domain-containing protein [Candidatus Sulfotelmatobacter sp.]|nr:VWA domain-containing protein [Candidatus Sulfotelmatobacter sp.]
MYVRKILVHVALGLFAYASVALSQTSIDDVHVTPVEKTATRSSALAEPQTIAKLESASIIRTSVNLVLVPVSITDDLNRPVIGLDQQNFQLFENKKPQEIKNFSSEDSPVSVGIILDTSGSMQQKLNWAREAVTQFCDAANAQDEFFLITFADVPQLATGFTTRTEEIENGLLTAQSKGRTSLLDAVEMGVREMREARYARKALLILSDGGDNHSRNTERTVKSAIKESDVLVYSVGIFDRYVATAEELLGPELLRTLSSLTGGTSYTLSQLNEMPTLTRMISTQLRYQYMLAYHPQATPHDGKWHKISVKLRLPQGLHASFLHIGARPGYYDGGGE